MNDGRKPGGYIAAAVLVVATVAILAFVLLAGGSDKTSKNAEQAARDTAAAAGCTLRQFPSEGRTHTKAKVVYRTNPPTSGPHNPVPAPDGEYDGAPPKENYVHSLEHGRVELQYRPDAPAVARAGLESVFKGDPSKMLLFPNNTSMPYAVAATAWTRLLACRSYNARVPAAMRAFRNAYRDKAPEKVG